MGTIAALFTAATCLFLDGDHARLFLVGITLGEPSWISALRTQQALRAVRRQKALTSRMRQQYTTGLNAELKNVSALT